MATKTAKHAEQLLKMADSGALDEPAADLLRRAWAALRRGDRCRATLALAEAHLAALAPAHSRAAA